MQARNDTTRFYIDLLSTNRIDHKILVQARNLKLKDMVWGGLLGNKNTHYSVTHKTDGIRKLLVFNEEGTWLIMAPTDINHVSRDNFGFSGYILDGELVPVDKRKQNDKGESIINNKYWYLAFDCLSKPDESFMSKIPTNIIQQENLKDRRFYCEKVSSFFEKQKLPLIKVNTKQFWYFDINGLDSPPLFYKTIRKMFSEQDLLPYKQDGVLFTPTSPPYNPHSDDFPLYERILTERPDICKWKPKENLSIDFSIEKKDDKFKLYSWNPSTFKLVEFTGTKRFPLTSIDNNHELTKEIESGTVVEYAWNYENKILYPYQLRFDKERPNSIDIARDVWNDINNPLEKETLIGDNMVQVRGYHNRIKKYLFDSIDKNSTLLDIGSGRGGDISKWPLGKIIAIEPNEDNIVELRSRLFDSSNRVSVIKAYGQDYDLITKEVKKIIGGKVDCVSLMLSLSFFWENEDILNDLITTIKNNLKDNGKILFFTIDGDAVEQVFRPAFPINSEQISINDWKLGNITMKYIEKDSKLEINIPDSIVGEQTEWLVRISDLMARLDYELLEVFRADNEKFLPEEYKLFSNLYTYGIFGKKEDIPLFKEEQEEEISISEITKTDVVKSKNITGGIIPSVEKKKLQERPSITISKIKIRKRLTAKQITELKQEVLSKMGPKPPLPEKPIDSFSIVQPKSLSMIPYDDYFQYIKVTWFNKPVVRIGTLGDGSCFFHAILKALYDKYANNSNDKLRKDVVTKFRRDLAYILDMTNEYDPQKRTYYEAAGDGQWKVLAEQQKEEKLVIEDSLGIPIDYSLEGMRLLFNSKRDVGEEVYGFISDILDTDIYVMIPTEYDLLPHFNTKINKHSNRNVIVIAGNGYHYELIGVDWNENGFQTVFSSDDDFIKNIHKWTKEYAKIAKPHNKIISKYRKDKKEYKEWNEKYNEELNKAKSKFKI
jgi:hypothetical protein